MEASTVPQLRPSEHYPEIVNAFKMLLMHDANPIWMATLRDEIDAALATERNTSYQNGSKDAGGGRSVSLDGADIKTVLDFIAPDLTPDELETPVTIAWMEGGHSGPGYYAYCTEYPEDGCIELKGAQELSSAETL
jgi:hypothetical protein